MRKKANILTENIIFIVLNIAFLTVLILFLFSKIGSAAILEEKYAKQIALILDSAKPEMQIKLNMEDAIKEKEDDIELKNIVSIVGNTVTVKLREDGGYSYSFFNEVNVEGKYFSDNNYVLNINKYREDE